MSESFCSALEVEGLVCTCGYPGPPCPERKALQVEACSCLLNHYSEQHPDPLAGWFTSGSENFSGVGEQVVWGGNKVCETEMCTFWKSFLGTLGHIQTRVHPGPLTQDC